MRRSGLVKYLLPVIAIVVGWQTVALKHALRMSGDGSQISVEFTDHRQDGFVLRFAPSPGRQRPVDLAAVQRMDGVDTAMRGTLQALTDWQDLRVDPIALFSHKFYWGGPAEHPEQHYLEVFADHEYYAFTKLFSAYGTVIDPDQLPILQLTWMIDQFPEGADLYHYYKVDRAIGVIVTFGQPIPSNLPGYKVPRGFAFVWAGPQGNAQPGDVLSCTPSLDIPRKKLFCHVPQVKYVVVRKGGTGVIQRDRINLVELFARYFPEHYQRIGDVPPVAAITIEAKTTEPLAEGTTSRARLYDLAFLPQS